MKKKEETDDAVENQIKHIESLGGLHEKGFLSDKEFKEAKEKLIEMIDDPPKDLSFSSINNDLIRVGLIGFIIFSVFISVLVLINSFKSNDIPQLQNPAQVIERLETLRNKKTLTNEEFQKAKFIYLNQFSTNIEINIHKEDEKEKKEISEK